MALSPKDILSVSNESEAVSSVKLTLFPGATGLAQCAELTWHLRGWANNRLAKGTKYCLQHNLGLGGAVVVTVYARADGKVAEAVSDAEVGQKTGLG